MIAINWALNIFRKRTAENQEEDLTFFLAVGPISLFCTTLLGLQQWVNLDLFVLGIVGLFLCMKMRTRGLIYSLMILLASSLFKHSFLIDHHLWQLGVEISMSIGLSLTAAATEFLFRKEASFIAKTQSQAKFIRNLEEDLVKSRQESLDEQIRLRDRISALQKECEDALSEVSTHQILNDVLRKSNAQTMQERESVAQKVQEAIKSNQSLISSIEVLKQESSRLLTECSDRNALVAEKNQLKEEIQETVAQKTALQERLSLFEQERSHGIQQLSERNQLISQMQDRLSLLGSEKEQLDAKLQALIHQAEIEPKREKEHWTQQITERDQLIALMQERLQALSLVENRFLELKKQFDEKNGILHQTRVELFLADTTIQAAKLEQDIQRLEPSFIENRFVSDLSSLEEERLMLEQENAELTDLVRSLVNEKQPKKLIERLKKTAKSKPKAKKKTKKKKPSLPVAEQTILF